MRKLAPVIWKLVISWKLSTKRSLLLIFHFWQAQTKVTASSKHPLLMARRIWKKEYRQRSWIKYFHIRLWIQKSIAMFKENYNVSIQTKTFIHSKDRSSLTANFILWVINSYYWRVQVYKILSGLSAFASTPVTKPKSWWILKKDVRKWVISKECWTI